MIKVFYDGECGLCHREISHYQSIAPDGVFEWINVMQDQHRLADIGIDLHTALKALHVKDGHGNLHKGVDGFIIIWKHLPRWKVTAWLIQLPIVYQLACFGYNHFGRWRFNRAGYDQL